MRQLGTVETIHVATEGGGGMQTVDEVYGKAGAGLVGDRYAENTGTFSKDEPTRPSQQATLIEAEALEAIAAAGFDLDPGDSRRNITTRGVALNHLVGREFVVGEVRLRGIKLCEPCGHLEKLTGRDGLRAALVHRGGLRAEVLHNGMIRAGDPIRAADPVPVG